VTIESNLISPDPLLEADLIEVVNKHIRPSDGQGQALRPEVACEVLTIMALDVLKALAWRPSNLQAADRCLREAIVHLRGG
jgi:hypothetical protein